SIHGLQDRESGWSGQRPNHPVTRWRAPSDSTSARGTPPRPAPSPVFPTVPPHVPRPVFFLAAWVKIGEKVLKPRLTRTNDMLGRDHRFRRGECGPTVARPGGRTDRSAVLRKERSAGSE